MTSFLQQVTDLPGDIFEFVRQAPGYARQLVSLIDDHLWIGGVAMMLAIVFEIYLTLWRRWNRVDDCVFCQIVTGKEYARIVDEWWDAIAIVPIDPVSEGHVLILPKTHVRDARVRPRLTGKIMRYAAKVARKHHAANIITSCGEEATQSIWHLHAHVAPRRKGDGLPLLWTGQKRSTNA